MFTIKIKTKRKSMFLRSMCQHVMKNLTSQMVRNTADINNYFQDVSKHHTDSLVEEKT